MSITNVHVAIIRHLRAVTVDHFVSENYIDGENVQVYATGVSHELAIFPLSNRDLKYLPEGVYTFQDKKIYEIGASGTLRDKGIIHFDNDRFLIDGGTRRGFEGGFITYLAKRISDSE